MDTQYQQGGMLSPQSQLLNSQEEVIQVEKDYESCVANPVLEVGEKMTVFVGLLSRLRKVSAQLRVLAEHVPQDERKAVEDVLGQAQRLRAAIIDQV